MSEIVITAYGTPVGQGRISFGRFGRGYHSNAKTLIPWRRTVAAAGSALFPTPLTGPVALHITVTVPKPKSAPKRRITWPVTRSSGDWDHHARAVSDALTGVAYTDDSQIVEGSVTKVYPQEGVDALDRPGAVIRVSQLGGDR